MMKFLFQKESSDRIFRFVRVVRNFGDFETEKKNFVSKTQSPELSEKNIHYKKMICTKHWSTLLSYKYSMCLLTALCGCTIIPQLYNRIVLKGTCHTLCAFFWIVAMIDIWWYIYAPQYQQFIIHLNLTRHSNSNITKYADTNFTDTNFLKEMNKLISQEDINDPELHTLTYYHIGWFVFAITCTCFVTAVHSVFNIRRRIRSQKGLYLGGKQKCVDMYDSLFCICCVTAEHMEDSGLTLNKYELFSWNGNDEKITK